MLRHILWIVLLIVTGCAAADNTLYEISVQKLIDSKELDGYWHLDTFSDRVPLKLGIPAEAAGKITHLKKFGQPVTIVTEGNDNADFIISKIHATNGAMEIHYRYIPEGIHGVASFTKDGAGGEHFTVTVHEN